MITIDGLLIITLIPTFSQVDTSNQASVLQLRDRLVYDHFMYHGAVHVRNARADPLPNPEPCSTLIEVSSGVSLCALVNNAAECPASRSETPEGVERQWATNVLGCD